jgi:hypothetical protein
MGLSYQAPLFVWIYHLKDQRLHGIFILRTIV